MALMSTPTATFPIVEAWMTAAQEPTASAMATIAPPCSSPSDCRFPSTGMVATTLSGDCSSTSTPILRSSSPSSIVHGSTVFSLQALWEM